MGAILALASLGWLVCWIMVVIKIFQNENVGLGILSIICGLFAFIYGWVKASEYGIQTLMLIWSVLFAVTIVLRFMLSQGQHV